MQKGFTLWFTGAKGSGKTDLAECVEGTMLERGMDVELLSEEILREDFATEQTSQDVLVKRAGAIANMLTRNNVPVIVAVNAQKAECRNEVREEIGQFVEVYCDNKTDSADFEKPEKAEVVVDPEADEELNCQTILRTVGLLGYLPDGTADSEYSEDEEEKIKKRLADLGYI